MIIRTIKLKTDVYICFFFLVDIKTVKLYIGDKNEENNIFDIDEFVFEWMCITADFKE